MSLKDLLVQLDATEASNARLEAALALARAFEAHLAALCLVVEPYVPAVVGVNLPAEVLAQQRQQAEAEAAALLDRAVARAAQDGIALERRQETVMVDRLADALARHARHADVTIVGQPDPERAGVDDTLMVEAAFMASGRPALVIPYIGARTMPPERVICAWDGSREAARAINDALPLLVRAREVSLVIIDPERLAGRVGEVPGADIGAHLARHGVEVAVKTVVSGGLDPGDVLLSTAADEAADLLVMGGYGHSRLRELILGGTTAHILKHMTVPVLFSH